MSTRIMITAAAALMLGATLPAQAQTTPAADSTAPTVQYRGDLGHTGYTTDTALTPLSLWWRHSTARTKGNSASPAAANGIIYFGSGRRVYAVSAGDGTQKWQFPASADSAAAFGTTPAIAKGYLYIGGDDATLYKIDASTGVQIWAKKVGGPVRSSPVVDGSVVYFGSADSHVYALNTETGEQVWSLPAEGSITSAPVLADGQVIFACTDNKIYSVSEATGKFVWSLRLPSDPSISPPVASGGMVYTGAGDTLYALNAHTGSLRWSARLPSQISGMTTLGSGAIYLATEDRKEYALSLDHGRKLWTAPLSYPSAGPALLAGSVLLVPGEHSVLYAFDAQTGATKWQYALQASGTASQPKYLSTDINAAPLWAEKTLFLLGDDGTLSAFRADAVDTVAPEVADLSPPPGTISAGVRIPYYATLIDMGSGINPATVALSVDKAPISLAKYDPTRNAVYVDFSKDTRGDSNRSLPVGTHQVLLTAQDWRGNTVSQTWAFTVDRRLNPRNTIYSTMQNSDMTPGGPDTNISAIDISASTNNAGAGGGSPSVASNPGPAGGPPPPPPLEGPGPGTTVIVTPTPGPTGTTPPPPTTTPVPVPVPTPVQPPTAPGPPGQTPGPPPAPI